MSSPTSLSPQASLQQALQLLQNQQWQAAEQLCFDLCQCPTPPADAVHLLALIYAQTQRPDLAENAFQQAITLAPQRADFYGNYANLLWELGRIPDTIHTCQQAITMGHQCPEVFNTLGNALFRSGDFQAASVQYQEALNLQPTYAEAHNNLGQALKAQKQHAAAEQCFRRALALQPDFAQAKMNLQQVDSLWLKPLQGKNLTLRRYAADDVNFLQRCFQDRVFMRRYNQFLPLLSDEALLAKLQLEQEEHPSQLSCVNWIILSQAKQRPIGIANLVEIQATHRRAEFLIGIPESADRVAGSGSEATLLVMDFAFNQLRLNKLITFVYSDNTASLKNNIALGLSRESYLKQHFFDSETQSYIDLCANALMESEFRCNRRLAKLSLRLIGRDVTLK